MIRYLKLLILIMSMLCSTAAVFAANKQDGSSNAANGIIVGQFRDAGKTPLAGGKVFFYDKAMGPPSSDKYVRVPDHNADLDQEGKFMKELPPGTYYFIARNKADVATVGPPTEGQLIYFKMDSKGEIQPFIVNTGKTTNAGVISSAAPRKRNQDTHGKGMTSIEGVIRDADGAPIAGAVVYAYVDPGILGKALYVSERTGKDGKFLLSINDGGNYYLRVRGDYGGGTPKEGEIVHLNDPKELTAVTVNKGDKLTGVTILVTRQKERGQLYQGNK